MLLLTFIEYSGIPHYNHRKYSADQIKGLEDTKTRAFVTRLTLGQALLKVSGYETAYKHKYALYVEYYLVGTAIIDDLNKEEREAGKLDLAEELPQTVEDFD